MTLIAHYRLDGNATDSIGDNDGTTTNVTWAAGKLGQAGSFNGTNSKIALSKISLFDFSVSFWVNFDTDGDFGAAGQMMFSEDGITSTFLRLINTDTFELATENDIEPRVTWANTGVVPSTYYHICLVRKGNATTLYINNQSQGERTTTYPLTITAIGTGRTDTRYVTKGDIDDFRIYDHALSEREVRDLSLGIVLDYPFNSKEEDESGVILDKSGQGNDTTTTAGSSVPTWQKDGGLGSYYFASGDNLKIPSIMIGRNNTISAFAWIKPQAGNSRATILFIDRWYFQFYNNDRLATYWYGRSPAGYHESPANSVLLDEWTFVGVVWSKDDVKFYVNGELTNTIASGGTGQNNNYVEIGMQISYGRPYVGNIRGIKVYDSEISSEYVKELYQQRASIDSGGSLHTNSLLETLPSLIGESGDEVTQDIENPASPSNSADSIGALVSKDKNGIYFSRGDGTYVTLPHYSAMDITEELTVETHIYYPSWDTPSSYLDPIVSRSHKAWGSQPEDFNLGGGYHSSNTESVRWNWTLGLGNSVDGRFGGTFADQYYPKSSFPRTFHVAGVYYKTATDHVIEIYVDGELHSQQSTALANWGGITNNTLPFRVNRSSRVSSAGSTCEQFDVRLWSVAKTQQEIQDNMYKRLDGDETGLVVYLPLNYGSSIHNYREKTEINSRFNSPTTSELGITRGLVAYYPLMGDTKDYADTNDGVNNGATATAEGYSFDGTNDYIETPYTPSSSVTSISFSALINPNSTITGDADVVNNYGGTGQHIICGFNGGTLAMFVDDGGTGTWINSGQSIGTTLHHVVWVYDNLAVTIYVDGVAYSAGTYAYTNPDLSERSFRIGARNTNLASLFPGIISHMKIHEVALTPEEVALEHKRLMNDQTKVSMTEDCLYINGQFKEIIS